MHDIHPVDWNDLSTAEIAHQWDQLSPYRAEQIREHFDLTFWHLLAPTIEELLRGTDLSRVLDVGCGTGELTHRIAQNAGSVLGVDVSSVALSLAKRFNSDLYRTAFLQSPIENVYDAFPEPTFSAAYANMVLMDIIDLRRALQSVSKLLLGRSVFVCSITHPFYWPKYRGYASAPWFHYSKELAIKAPFRITTQTLTVPSIHIHRPIRMYAEILRESGFTQLHFFEPLPPSTGNLEYDRSWKYPRYLFIACMRQKRHLKHENAKAISKTWLAPWLRERSRFAGARDRSPT